MKNYIINIPIKYSEMESFESDNIAVELKTRSNIPSVLNKIQKASISEEFYEVFWHNQISAFSWHFAEDDKENIGQLLEILIVNDLPIEIYISTDSGLKLIDKFPGD